ncbi:MAG: NADH:ubiquinone reductase (Na(+)-transporting) subunit A, partial [Candidatus Hydrogenedentes bacterium]|nr:NADH:ubiquinone reductase (Na(+)-transporting) subunit A [Candidatus Hydrogenedentota bacterium]
MGNHQIRKGLTLPISGAPRQEITTKAVDRIAVIALDYMGLKSRILVQPGDLVKRGQALFEDKKVEGVLYTSPGAGTVRAVNRGERRALQSVEIDLSAEEIAGNLGPDDYQSFSAFTGAPVSSLSREEVCALMLESGLWTALRTRPLSRVPHPESIPHSIFITACDSNPLAPSMDVIAEGRQEALDAGVAALCK